MVGYDPTFGVYSTDKSWVPNPNEIMKRAAILDLVKTLKAGSVLEIGCGAGALIHDLARKNFRGKGIDTSVAALGIARSLFPSGNHDFLFDSSVSESDAGSYDYVIAISVLEHIEDDRHAVREWGNCLKPGGRILISVPAHRRLWGINDIRAGHYRRYERSDLVNLMKETGFTIQAMYSYGYPVINLLKRISNVLLELRGLRQRERGDSPSLSEATASSGIKRPIWVRVFPVYSSKVFIPVWKTLFHIQRRWYGSDRGTGYVLLAAKDAIPA